MILREWLYHEMQEGRITFKQFRTKIRAACRYFYVLNEPRVRAMRGKQEREEAARRAYQPPPMDRILFS
jgi:hypothetical protein